MRKTSPPKQYWQNIILDRQACHHVRDWMQIHTLNVGAIAILGRVQLISVGIHFADLGLEGISAVCQGVLNLEEKPEEAKSVKELLLDQAKQRGPVTDMASLVKFIRSGGRL